MVGRFFFWWRWAVFVCFVFLGGGVGGFETGLWELSKVLGTESDTRSTSWMVFPQPASFFLLVGGGWHRANDDWLVSMFLLRNPRKSKRPWGLADCFPLVSQLQPLCKLCFNHQAPGRIKREAIRRFFHFLILREGEWVGHFFCGAGLFWVVFSRGGGD